jgi:RNase P/RNase MRP subunit p29
MFARSACAVTALLIGSSLVLAAAPKDSTAGVEGTITQVNAGNKTITIKTGNGTQTISVNEQTRFIDASGKPVSQGMADHHVASGATIQVTLAPDKRSAREVHLVSETTAARKAETAVMNAAPPAYASVQGHGIRNGLSGTILKVDPQSKIITVEINGKPTDYQANDQTQFLSPLQQASRLGIRDGRVVAGAQVTLVADGNVLKEVHLPYRYQLGK